MSDKPPPNYPQQPYAPPAYPPPAGATAPYPAAQPGIAGYYPNAPAAGQQGQQVVVVTSPTVIRAGGMFGETPMQTTCPSCQNTIVTAISYENGTLTWIAVGVLCLVGCWPCCLIPFCVNGCKDVRHSCPSCNNVIGYYRRMS